MVREEYILEAISQALKSPLLRKHGAIVIKDNRVIARGFNRYIEACSIESKRRKLSIHAEKDALSKVSNGDLVGTILIVIRISPKGDLIMSKPCLNCQKYIKRKKISVTYYSFSELTKKNIK